MRTTLRHSRLEQGASNLSKKTAKTAKRKESDFLDAAVPRNFSQKLLQKFMINYINLLNLNVCFECLLY